MNHKLSSFNGLLIGVASSLYVYRHHSFIDFILFAVLISFVPLLIVYLISDLFDDDLLGMVFNFVSFLPVGVLISSILISYLNFKKIFH
jgi:hypothetical protein